MLPPTRLLNCPSGVRPNPNAVSRPLMSGLAAMVFLTLLTVITNELPDQLLTVNVAVARRVAPGFTPCHVTVNEVFPFTNTLTCAEPGAAAARSIEHTRTVSRRVLISIFM